MRVSPYKNLSYDPRISFWYLEAKAALHQIWTNIYLYKPKNHLLITLAKPFYKERKLLGVLGINISLDWLSWYLGEQHISKNTQIFIVDNKGKLIAYPKFYQSGKPITSLIDIKSLNKPWDHKSI